jgi:hypothetical protein
MKLPKSLIALSDDLLPQVFGGIRDGGRRRAYRPVAHRSEQTIAYPLECLAPTLEPLNHSPYLDIVPAKKVSLQAVPEHILSLVSGGMRKAELVVPAPSVPAFEAFAAPAGQSTH